MLQNPTTVPRRTDFALTTTVFTSPWSTTWDRLHRQVFWLADGQRDVLRISQLLHKPLDAIERVVRDLTVNGYTSLQHEKELLVMNIALLRASFDMVAPQKEAFAHSFYERLFSYYPATRALFAHTDMRRQESSLMATLAVVVAGVERGDNLVPTLQTLGSKHERYGAKPEHYPLVGGVLLETFTEYLGAQFTPEMQDSWSKAFEIISTEMIAATEQKNSAQ